MQTELTIIDADDRATVVDATVDGEAVLVASAALAAATGWALKPEGLCRGDVCVPTRGRDGLVVDESVDVVRFAALVGEPLVVDLDAAVVAYGTPAGARADELRSLHAPAFEVEDLAGSPTKLADFAGRKKLLIAFASWCGCRYDLPDWQQLHDELEPHGFTAIGVAVDEHVEDVTPWTEQVDFPVLLDRDHVITERYDIRNVPTVIWIDEDDRIVRPQDGAFGSDVFIEFHGIDSAPHHEALRRWVVDGIEPFEPDEVRAQVVVPTPEEQLARVHWRVAVHLHRLEDTAGAERHFALAGDLAPHDLAIRRSALLLRGIDPFLSEEFLEMYDGYQRAGRPGYAFDHPTTID